MFEFLGEVNKKPVPFEFSTANELWTDKHISKIMLDFHLDENIDAASRSRKFIDKSSEWIYNNFIKGASPDIIDFGCGPGLYTTPLAEMGANVTGIDFSDNSLIYARKTAKQKNLHIDYICSDYMLYDTDKRFNLILMIMCDFCVLSPAERRSLLDLFYKLLKPGGAVLLDVYTIAAFNNRKEQVLYAPNLMDGFWSPDKYYGYLNTFKYDNEKLILDKYTIVEKNRIRYFYNWLQSFTEEKLSAEFNEHNFTIENIYADICGSPLQPESQEMAIVARKPV